VLTAEASRAETRVVEVERNRSPAVWAAGQVLLIALAIVAYFRIRGLTDAATSVAMHHAAQLQRLEAWLDFDVEGAVQAPVLASARLATLANWVYVWGHWPVIVCTLGWLLLRHRDGFRLVRDAMLVSGFLGMAVFVTYPVAPPRLADPALVDTVTESSAAYRYLQPPAFVNQYAAMPSLHAGWNLVVGLAIAGVAASMVVRVLGLVMPALMMWAVVATANHYVLDVVAGVGLALVGLAVAHWLETRRTRRRIHGDAGPG
jgi:hypothetical protein